MSNRLSHSSVSHFQKCPQSWAYHYKENLRSNVQSAALLFGSAVDAAIMALLTEGRMVANTVFKQHWTIQEINGVETSLNKCTDIVYANSDYDAELLDDNDIAFIKLQFNVEDPLAEIAKIYEEKEYAGFVNLPEDRKKLLNFANWLCLNHKGFFMLDAVEKKVMPNIEEVYKVQARVDLENGDGDSIIGYADLVCKWKDIKEPIIFDFKTSSRDYDKDSVLVSPQLTLYVHALADKYKTRKAGYIVLNKLIRKNKTKKCSKCGVDGTGKKHKTCDFINEVGERCHGSWDITLNPEVYTQIIIDDIPEQTENIVLENMDMINSSVKNNIFYRNFQSCSMPWGRCAYWSKCFKGKDDSLIKIKKD